MSDQARRQSAAERTAPLKVLGGRADKVLLHERYLSLQGEGTRAGRLCQFVRLTGCHLRCGYCDTEHAFFGGDVVEVDWLVRQVRAAGVELVQLTGGEPLLQPGAFSLTTALLDAGHEVVIETSGAVSTARVDPRAVVVLDVKTPGSGEMDRNVTANIGRLRAQDEVKFVICDRADYVFARDFVKAHHLAQRCTVLFSPEAERMDKAALARWMIDDKSPARLSIQVHRVLFGDVSGV